MQDINKKDKINFFKVVLSFFIVFKSNICYNLSIESEVRCSNAPIRVATTTWQ